MDETRCYTVITTSGVEYRYDGTPDALTTIGGQRAGYCFLVCAGGTLINLEHVVALRPIG